jgi:hypothetical protein
VPEKPDENTKNFLKGLQNLDEKRKEEDLKTFTAAMKAKAARQKGD